MDKRVEIHGTSRADLNGKRGVATDFHFYGDVPHLRRKADYTKNRYTVRLDSGEAFKVKTASLRVEGEGKAKGKGKGKGKAKAKPKGRKGPGRS